MASNKIKLPSGSGGITRYFEHDQSKLLFSPGVVIVLVIVVIIIEIIVHLIGSARFGI